MKLALPDGAILDTESRTQGCVGETQSVLLFTNDPAELFGIPMAVVARIERVRIDQIDTVGGQEVLQYRGVSLPLLCLENHIQASPRLEAKKIYVVVFSVAGKEMCLIAPTLIDICLVPTTVDTTTFVERGVLGSLVVEGKAMRLLDVYKLAQAAHPNLFKQPQAIECSQARGASQNANNSQPATILLAEDSTFFRLQVTSQLEEAGYRVVGCEDGLIAWNNLRERGEEIDLVVTDIEMPNLDGCQLARRIKDDPALSSLPIIALTSLASEKDMQRGMESGIDDYQIKLDRERLMTAVSKYLHQTESPVGSASEFAATAGMESQS